MVGEFLPNIIEYNAISKEIDHGGMHRIACLSSALQRQRKVDHDKNNKPQIYIVLEMKPAMLLQLLEISFQSQRKRPSHHVQCMDTQLLLS